MTEPAVVQLTIEQFQLLSHALSWVGNGVWLVAGLLVFE